MPRRLRFRTSVNCTCGATGQLVWEEDEAPNTAAPVNYEIISLTDGFVPDGPGQGVCGTCPRTDADEKRAGGLFWGVVCEN